jgi:hypothetical protein
VAARARRDAGVTAFLELRRAHAGDGGEALRRFHRRAVALVQPQLATFERVWQHGPQRAAATTHAQLEAIAAGAADHLADASVHRLDPPPAERRMGCCGTLGTYVAGRAR